MNRVSYLFAGATAALLMVLAGVSSASAQSAPQQSYMDPGFDWDGFYAGLSFSVEHWSDGTFVYMPEGVGGFNVTMGNALVGVETTVSQGFNSKGWGAFQARGKVRAGAIVLPNLLLYGSGGIAYFCIPNDYFATLGGGVEYAVNDTVSIDTEYEHWFGTKLNGDAVSTKLLFHF